MLPPITPPSARRSASVIRPLVIKYLSGGRGLANRVLIEGHNPLVETADAEAAAKAAHVGAGKKIADTAVRNSVTTAGSVAGEVGLENAAGKSADGQGHAGGQRTVEVADQS